MNTNIGVLLPDIKQARAVTHVTVIMRMQNLELSSILISNVFQILQHFKVY